MQKAPPVKCPNSKACQGNLRLRKETGMTGVEWPGAKVVAMKPEMLWKWHTEGVTMKEEVHGRACSLAWNVVAWVWLRGVAYEGGGKWRVKSFRFSEQNREPLECSKERMTWSDLFIESIALTTLLSIDWKWFAKAERKQNRRNDSGSDQGSSSGGSANWSGPRFAESVDGECEIEKRQELLWRFGLE